MRTEPNEPIAPCLLQRVGEGPEGLRANKPSDPKEWHFPVAGLTKREQFAAMAMQGYCGGEHTGQSGMPAKIIAEWCVTMADALIEQLNQPINQ